MKFIYTKAFLIFAATLVLIVIVLFLQNKGYLDRVRTFLLQAPRPVVGAAKSVALPVKNFFGTLYNLNDLVEKNSDLEIQLQQAHEKLVLLQEYQNQNEILKNELGFKNKSSNTLVPCTVLIVDPEGLTDAIVLNCGSKVGVRESFALEGASSTEGVYSKARVFCENHCKDGKCGVNKAKTVDTKTSARADAKIETRGSSISIYWRL